MSDNYPMNTSEARERGTRGIMAAGAGLGLWIVNGLLFLPVFRMPLLSWIVGGTLAFVGASGLFGKQKIDKSYGLLFLGAGASIALLPGLTRMILGLGGLGLVSFGIYNIVKFVKGLRNRA